MSGEERGIARERIFTEITAPEGAISRREQDGEKERQAGAEHLPRGLQTRVVLRSIISSPGTALTPSTPHPSPWSRLLRAIVKELIMIILNACLDLNRLSPDGCGSRAGGKERPRVVEKEQRIG